MNRLQLFLSSRHVAFLSLYCLSHKVKYQVIYGTFFYKLCHTILYIENLNVKGRDYYEKLSSEFLGQTLNQFCYGVSLKDHFSRGFQSKL